MAKLLRAAVGHVGAIGLVGIGLTLSHPARADLVFSGTGTDISDGTALSATVDFSLTGSLFQIVITNNDAAISPGSVLTNLGVTVAPAPATSLPSASGTIALTGGSSFVSSGKPGTLFELGQEWAYLVGGVASSGFGVGTGDGNLCGGTDPSLCTANGKGNKQALDGAPYGLVGTGTDVSQANLKNNYYVQKSVTVDITLAANSTFTLADITSVDFQYGTAPDEGAISVTGCTSGTDCGKTNGPPVQPAPEPASIAVLAVAMAGLGWHRRTGGFLRRRARR